MVAPKRVAQRAHVRIGIDVGFSATLALLGRRQLLLGRRAETGISADSHMDDDFAAVFVSQRGLQCIDMAPRGELSRTAARSPAR